MTTSIRLPVDFFVRGVCRMTCDVRFVRLVLCSSVLDGKDKGSGGEGAEGGGGIHVFHAVVVKPLTTPPQEDEALFLPIALPYVANCGRSKIFFLPHIPEALSNRYLWAEGRRGYLTKPSMSFWRAFMCRRLARALGKRRILQIMSGGSSSKRGRYACSFFCRILGVAVSVWVRVHLARSMCWSVASV